MTDIYLTFDDVQILPAYSEIESRDDVSLETQFTKNYRLETPFVASPMPDVCELEMAKAMWELGGVGIIHRFMTIDEQVNMAKGLWVYTNAWHSENPVELHFANPIIATAIGVTGDYFGRARALVDDGRANVLMLDVAHGHHKNVKLAMKELTSLKNEFQFDIIAGTIATPKAANDLIDWGADALRVGVGGGCFTPQNNIRTSNGLKKIEDIEIGTLVYSHTGKLQSVINKIEFDRNEEIVVINDIECTKNHEFYVVRREDISETTEENIHLFAKWIAAEDLDENWCLIELE